MTFEKRNSFIRVHIWHFQCFTSPVSISTKAYLYIMPYTQAVYEEAHDNVYFHICYLFVSSQLQYWVGNMHLLTLHLLNMRASQ